MNEKNLYENLKNMEYFFKEYLGFNCFWSRDKDYFPRYSDKDSLVMQTISPYHIAKYMTNEEAVYWGINPKSTTSEDVAEKDEGLEVRTNVWFPYILLQPSLNNDYFDTNGDYYCRISGIMASKIINYVTYFCYCFKRNEQAFLTLSNEIIEEIEAFLTKHKLKICGKDSKDKIVRKNKKIKRKIIDVNMNEAEALDNIANAVLFFSKNLNINCFWNDSLEFIEFKKRMNYVFSLSNPRFLVIDLPTDKVVKFLDNDEKNDYDENNLQDSYTYFSIEVKEEFDANNPYQYLTAGTGIVPKKIIQYITYFFDWNKDSFDDIPQEIKDEIAKFLFENNLKKYID